ncbi:MAG: tetratricopeptide repeat protein [Polyangiaceae bacterium]|nr:tetratricopeptide repeat protein [Polyangiaceae bacterium]
MQSSSPPPRSSRVGFLSFDATKLENEEEVLSAILLAISKNQLDAEVWRDLHAAAIRDNRVAELAFAYDAVAHGRKLRALPPMVQAELYYRAGTFFCDVLGDDFGATTYFERALRAFPAHPGAFERIDALLTRAEDHTKLADLCIQTAAHCSKTDQRVVLQRAAGLYERAGLDDKAIETYQQLVRLDPTDESARDLLEVRYVKVGRYRDLARMLEQALAALPLPDAGAPPDVGAIRVRAKLIDVFANHLKEPERAMAHVEAVLAVDPAQSEARRVAGSLLDNKGLAARAAAALAAGAESTEERAHLYGIELENTRGPRRRDVLRRIGILKQDELSDFAGAFEAFEQALGIDPTDDELRVRYAELGCKIKGPLEVAKVFARVYTVAKDSAVRSRITAEMGTLLLRGGDAKRARTTLAGVLVAPGADSRAVLIAARALTDVYEADQDTRSLTDVLSRIGEISTDEAERQQANERVAELAANTGDVDQAIVAWRRLVDTPAHSRALAALEPLYERRGEWHDLSFVLAERAKELPDRDQARALSMRAAEVLTTKTNNLANATEAWRQIIEAYGPARDVYAKWMPLLETQRQWSELAVALVNDARLAPEEQRPAIFARLGTVHITRIGDVDAAIEAFRNALEGNPQEKTSRAALEKLLLAGERRLAVAAVLEPVYQRDNDDQSLLRVLDVKALLLPAVGDRLAVLEQAADLAARHSRDKALDFVRRGLVEAVENEENIQGWLDRFDKFAVDADPKKRAAILSSALGEHEIDSHELVLLAKRVGEEHAASGNVAAALAVLRRALTCEPSSAELIGRVDELLREQGTPEERVALFRAALEQNPDPARRQKLLHAIGSVERHELANTSAAILAYRHALKDDSTDTAAFSALAELYEETEAWDALSNILADRLPRAASKEETRRIRTQLADIACAHDQHDRAIAHAWELLADPELGGPELDLVERVAVTTANHDLLRALLERRASNATDPKAQIECLTRLATLAETTGSTDLATARLRQAADMARSAGDDTNAITLFDRLRGLNARDRDATTQLAALHERAENWATLPALYDALVDIAESDDERVAWLRKLAGTLADRLGNAPSGFTALAKAFAIEPGDATLLAETEALALRASREREFSRVIDQVLEHHPDLARGAALDLGMAKARALAARPSTAGEAAVAFRDVLDKVDDVRLRPAIEGLEAVLGNMEPSAERTTWVRWLFAFRVARALPEQRSRVLFEAAMAEERELSDPKAALDMYRRVVELDPNDLDALSAISRLSLAEGDVEGAIEALVACRSTSEGAAGNALDVQIANILFERGGRGHEALERLERVFDDAPHDADAIELAAKLSTDPSLGIHASAVLEKALDTIDDPAVLVDALGRLLAHRELDADLRFSHYERLLKTLILLGRNADAYEVVLAACRESPSQPALWDRAEAIAQELSLPEPLAELYTRVLTTDTTDLPKDKAIDLGQRAVAFHEEWFDDDDRIIGLLERLVEIDPENEWAFDRLKLIFDSQEHWDDLFALYDRAAHSAPRQRRITVLEEAAQVAKDFADHPKRAIGYFEELLELEPGNAQFEGALERLYDRHGCYRELIVLLGSRIAVLPHDLGQKERARIAGLWLNELSDTSSAIIVVDDLLAHQIEGDDEGIDVVGLLERILAAAPHAEQVQERAAQPPEGHRDSYAPVAKARGLVRQRAAALLRDRYSAISQKADLARVLEVQLEAVDDGAELARRHKQIATLYTELGKDDRALDHVVKLVLLEPAIFEYRAELAAIVGRTGRYDRLVEVLVSAADGTEDKALQVELLMGAGVAAKEKIGDSVRAIELFFRVLSVSPTADAVLLEACREVEPLLAQASRREDRLDVLEKLAILEQDTGTRVHVLGEAARLATELEEHDRAIWAWEGRLETSPHDREAIDGLAQLFEKTERWSKLVGVLGRRADLGEPDGPLSSDRRADRVRMAHIQSDKLEASFDAIGTWQQIESLFGDSDESTRALASLFRTTRQWNELTELLGRAALRSQVGTEKADILRELGDVQRLELNSEAAAIASYENALTADPHNEGSRVGLHALLARLEQRSDVVRVLLAAYYAADDWQLVVDLTEQRLSCASDQAAQIAILTEAASISETRAHDARAAFALTRRALLVDPNSTPVLDELFRLAAATDNFRSLADTLRECIDAAPIEKSETGEQEIAPPWIDGHRFRMGEVLETHLGEPRAALEAFVAVAQATPSSIETARAVIRTAALTFRWDAAAHALVETTRARGALESELIVAIEQAAESANGWDAMTSATTSLIHDGGGLAASLARDLEATIAVWHRDRRGDPGAAEAAYTRALSFDPTNAELLAPLAQLQRRAKGRPLVDSLLRLSQATGGDLDLLSEAADVAFTSIGDRDLSKSIFEQLLQLAIDRWTNVPNAPVAIAGAPGASSSLGDYVQHAMQKLVHIYSDEDNYDKVVTLLVDTASLPWERERARGLRHEAAEIASSKLAASDRATGIYLGLIDEDPHDAVAVERLIFIYKAGARKVELLSLERRLTDSARTADERLALRLEVASLEDEVENVTQAIVTLEKNLAESPRHQASVNRLATLLTRESKHEELESLFAGQAALAEAGAERELAANLYEHAANVAELKLGDVSKAIGHLRRVVDLEPRPSALDALARLSTSTGDYNGAAGYLDRLRDMTLDASRATITLRLADALTAAHRKADAQARLENEIARDPDADDVRMRLADIYRHAQSWSHLALLLTEGAAHAPDKAMRLSRLQEAAELHRDRTGEPELAIPLLEQASELAPDQSAVKLALADALGAAARFDEAQVILRALIDAFGRRRPKERALVHYHLARIHLAVKDRAQALVELDAAWRIDPIDSTIVRTLAELARDEGQLEKAERSYRALLTLLRRQENPTDETLVTRSDVLFELLQIARRQGEVDRAGEILESLFELGAKNQVEARRLEAALRKANDHASLARSLESRLARAGYVAGSADLDQLRSLALRMDDAASVFSDLGRLYETVLGRSDDALEMRMSALEMDPSSADLHHDARRLSSALGKAKVYEDRVRALADHEGRPEVASELFVRLARIAETENGDNTEAASLYERAFAVRQDDREVLTALDRVYEQSGDYAGQARVLGMRVALDAADGGASSSTLYRLAELRFRSGDVEAACDAFEQAFESNPDAERAEDLLREAAKAHPQSERILEIYERLARTPGRERTLIDVLMRKWNLPGQGTDSVREAAVIAQKIGDTKLAEELLRKWLEREKHDDDAARVWALSLLSTICEGDGRTREAALLKRAAAKIAEPGDAKRLLIEVAALAAGALDDLQLSASIYEDLLARDPADRDAWTPLLDVYRRLEDFPKLAALLAVVIGSMDDVGERSKLRLEHVRIGVEKLGLPDDDAANELREIVDDDPSSVEAAVLLGTILERTGRDADLADLLSHQLDTARDRKDAEAVISLSRRLGALLERTNRNQACVVYYAALDWDPQAPDLLLALERLHEQEGQQSARAEIMERRLALATGSEAETLALTLAEIRDQKGDAEAAMRALEIGFRSLPESHNLESRLEALYREQGEYEKLAELYVQNARKCPDGRIRAERLRDAARIYKDELSDVERAATVLREARSSDPTNALLFEQLIEVLVNAGDFVAADHELAGALEGLAADDPTHLRLIVRRATVRARTSNVKGALMDFEEALAKGAVEVRGPLAQLLGKMAVAAAGRGDTAEWRKCRLRIADLRLAMGEVAETRDVLTELAKTDAKDRTVLRALASLDELEGHWEAASATYRRLVGLEEGEGIVTAAFKLAETCEKANRLEDARSGLERARVAAPNNVELRQRLLWLYEQLGAHKELANLVLEEARASRDTAQRFEGLVRGGQLLLAQAQDPTATTQIDTSLAVRPLEEAHALRPADLDCAALLSDAYVVAGRIDDAEQLLHRTIATFKGRRARELSAFYHRLARTAEIRGDNSAELAHLTTALDMDAQNGVVATELSYLAMEIGNWDIAQRALRAITMMKAPAPLSRALAYQHLGEIARTQGDDKRAASLFKRALDNDPTLESARALYEELQASN